MFKRKFYTQNFFSKERVGPHNEDVISVLVGHLLTDGYGEKRKNSTRFQIHMSSLNAEYVFWSFKFFAEKGYSSPKKTCREKTDWKKEHYILFNKMENFFFFFFKFFI